MTSLKGCLPYSDSGRCPLHHHRNRLCPVGKNNVTEFDGLTYPHFVEFSEWYMVHNVRHAIKLRSHSECSWKRGNEAKLMCVCCLEIESM